MAFVIKTLPSAEKAQRKFPGSCGRLSMTNCSVLQWRKMLIIIMRISAPLQLLPPSDAITHSVSFALLNNLRVEVSLCVTSDSKIQNCPALGGDRESWQADSYLVKWIRSDPRNGNECCKYFSFQ